MAIDWKTILSEFDGKPTLLQAIGKLRKAVEEETITIQEAQAEIDKLEAQQKADEAIIAATQTTIEDALSLAQTNEQDIAKLDSEIIDKVDKIEKGDLIRVYGVGLDGNQTFYEITDIPLAYKIPRYNPNGRLKSNRATKDNEFVQLNEALNTIFDDKTRFFFNGKIILPPDENGKMVVVDSLKTIFGNQSIVGKGNIDLYKHHIEITGTDGEAPPNFGIAGITPVIFEFYSSKNTVCDSLTDLKTLLGDTFLVNANGWLETLTGSYQVIYVSETYIYYIKDSAVAKTPLIFTISDTVTTI